VTRLLRILFNFVTAVLLLLFVAATWVWVRGQFVSDFVELLGGGAYVMASTNANELNARVCLNYPFSMYSRKPPPRFVHVDHSTLPAGAYWKATIVPGAVVDWRHGGVVVVTWDSGELKGSIPTALIVLPHWLLAASAGILPLARWALAVHRRVRRARRVAAGLCLVCGYDLRGSPDRCPECGTVPLLQQAGRM
jgi:hypothetical protein